MPAMPGNTFGSAFRVTTFGESHGAAIGCVIDGCPAGHVLDREALQAQLARRRPGQSTLVTPRDEQDTVEIVSGLDLESDRTLGTPICMLVRNQDQRSGSYSDWHHIYRPSHADYTYDAKYGLRAWQGGGRSSARETVGRVAAEKNLDLSVRAFQAARAKVPDSLLVLVGDGPERRRFTGIEGVRCVGTRCGEELGAHYASADVFLFPSLTETYGNVLIEAMASQLASVSFFYAAAKEVIVDNDRGLSVACGDEAAFIGAAVRLAMDGDLRRRLAARGLAIGSERSWPAVMASFVQHVREAIRRGGSPVRTEEVLQ
jgi:glycosyltransferase involved in cell wall biosynthesis